MHRYHQEWILSVSIINNYCNIYYYYTKGKQAFEKCSFLTLVDLAVGLTVIGESMFANTGLVEITIPSTVTSMGINILITIEILF